MIPTDVMLVSNWGVDPWFVKYGSEGFGVSSPETIEEAFAVPADLMADIEAWDETNQALFDRNDPRESGTLTPTELAAFLDRGRELARRLRGHLPADVGLIFAGAHFSNEERF